MNLWKLRSDKWNCHYHLYDMYCMCGFFTKLQHSTLLMSTSTCTTKQMDWFTASAHMEKLDSMIKHSLMWLSMTLAFLFRLLKQLSLIKQICGNIPQCRKLLTFKSKHGHDYRLILSLLFSPSPSLIQLNSQEKQAKMQRSKLAMWKPKLFTLDMSHMHIMAFSIRTY